MPRSLLCQRSDRHSQQRVCRPVHPALQESEERWASKCWKVEGWRAVRWRAKLHQVTMWGIIVFPLNSQCQHYWRFICVSVEFLWKWSRMTIRTVHFFSNLQATGGCLSYPKTASAWIQPPYSSISRIPKKHISVSDSLTWRHRHTRTPCQQIEKRSWCGSSSGSNNENI